MTKCYRCSHPAQSGAQICSRCGAPLDEQSRDRWTLRTWAPVALAICVIALVFGVHQLAEHPITSLYEFVRSPLWLALVTALACLIRFRQARRP